MEAPLLDELEPLLELPLDEPPLELLPSLGGWVSTLEPGYSYSFSALQPQIKATTKEMTNHFLAGPVACLLFRII
ncbi:hypothetical protein ACONUD_16295 [Microbulbifer harenosus]|uniref:Uncharacterized protein n=1 Tax=Microbulbifer harenosus TaxID=2576840 RepID=A0ABY2UEQ9_9GAMM|nr:hypothetical protein [Microbulbifer harenosus]TLM75637.1 hypothetical protein FDY93_15170 [Microbulbifer harenosus]